jgi:MrcB-like, N-terminal domain/Glycosyl hydrolases family 25
VQLRTLIGEIGAKYDRRLPMSSEAQKLLRQVRIEFEQWIPAGYAAEGSGGTVGKAAVAPKIAVFNTDGAVTARRGIYVAYLFAADMSTVTLTLNQGITEIAEQLGRAGARRALVWEAADVRAAFSPGDIADLDTTIDLRSTDPQSVDYQRANILARTYELTALPDEPTMVADLQRFIRLYALAVDARGGGRQPGDQATVTTDRGPAANMNAAKPEPKSEDEHRQRPPEGARPAKVVNRRGLLVALAAMPAAVVAPTTLGLALGREEESRSPDVAPRFTIDVSQHDWNRRGGNLDWVAVRRAGIAGMCARATYGDPSGYHHPSYHFGDFVRAAKAAGLHVRGGYHNLVRGDQASINLQVDWLRRELDAYDANWAMLDVERYAELVSADMWPRWDDVRRFDDRWAAVEDRVLVGYLPPWNWNRHLGQPDLRAFRGPLIASNYPLRNNADEYRRLYARCGGDKGRGWASYGNRTSEGWQFSARAEVPGAASACGINAWRMTFDQLNSLLTKPI